MQVKENIKESDRCNCGRSPTGECIGCYFLTGAEFGSVVLIDTCRPHQTTSTVATLKSNLKKRFLRRGENGLNISTMLSFVSKHLKIRSPYVFNF